MAPNPTQRPDRPSPTQRPQSSSKNSPKRVISSGGGRGGGGRGGGGRGGGSRGGGGGSGDEPSPWLDAEQVPIPHPSASFVEYLRWMREPTRDYKDPTKVQILDWATEQANYDDRLKQLTDRTKKLATDRTKKLAVVHFQVKCPWRIRVGGTKGPESILLPAFDALGMPYIPSSTLRGVARSQAVREVMKKYDLQWNDAQAHPDVTQYFGHLEAEDKDRAAKIVFLDAYPLPGRHGLAMDMANNIWNWPGGAGELPNYSPNPNPFLSLREPTFLIGLRLASHCSDQKEKVLEPVKKWLEAGLQSGIGSQVNTGYGALYAAGVGQPKGKGEFFRVDFSLEGQLIHGCQHFTQWSLDKRGNWQMRGRAEAAEAEVRPVAFKSMLRYWFRAFALGVLDDNQQVQTLENRLFGGINPEKSFGYLQVNILNGEVRQKEPQGKNDPCGEQQGTLVLSLSSEVPPNQQDAVKKLAQYLTWLMFNLGGIGQGARRPCYSRKTRPWYRGSTFYIESDSKFWDAPDSAKQFCQQFQGNLRKFYDALATLLTTLERKTIDPSQWWAQRREVVPQHSPWAEAVDRHCKILICSGPEKNGKPFALSVLHSPEFKKNGDYDGDLCGRVFRGVQPSPVWIADLGDYQVVTIFGATQDPRKSFASELERQGQTFSVFPKAEQ